MRIVVRLQWKKNSLNAISELLFQGDKWKLESLVVNYYFLYFGLLKEMPYSKILALSCRPTPNDGAIFATLLTGSDIWIFSNIKSTLILWLKNIFEVDLCGHFKWLRIIGPKNLKLSLFVQGSGWVLNWTSQVVRMTAQWEEWGTSTAHPNMAFLLLPHVFKGEFNCPCLPAVSCRDRSVKFLTIQSRFKILMTCSQSAEVVLDLILL